MKAIRSALFLVALLVLPALPSFAAQRYIVRDTLGLPGIKLVCDVVHCSSTQALGDPSGQLFRITTGDQLNVNVVLSILLGQFGVVSAEVDQALSVVEPALGPIPESLWDQTPLSYYGTPVWEGYALQPASDIVRVAEAQTAFGVSGSGTVAIIDTGVDPKHPALQQVLIPGYDFISNSPGADETNGGVNQSSAAVLDGGGPVFVNSYTVAWVNQSSAAVLDGGGAAFGHGTMTAGIVHLVAPNAKILPLKAFSPDGSGYVSDVIHATYYAVGHGAKVLSMSFSFSDSSKELSKAMTYATNHGVIAVASAGNDGEEILVYPAALSNVMGVASTTDYDTRSSFSNYGSQLVWVAAPGEGIVTTYPYGTYAAGWGTSFSAPFVSGTAALLVDTNPSVDQTSAARAIANAKWISSDLGNGRLDVYLAVQAWRQAVGK